MRRHLIRAASFAGLLTIACTKDQPDARATSNSAATPSTPVATSPVVDSTGRMQLVIGSTTSTQDSGLLDVLIPAFEKAEPSYHVKVVAVGTGQALELGRRKDADVLLVHSPAAESEFVSKGYGARRCLVMYNDFIIAGPKADPARIAGLNDAVEAVRRIAATHSPFISRGDDSGTHKEERALWDEAHITPSGDWYISAGQGMGEVLGMAAEKFAYTLSDRGTYLAVRDSNALDILVQGDKRLRNQYGVIPVANARNAKGADAFTNWIISADAQAMIADFGIAKYGQPLFIPDADGC